MVSIEERVEALEQKVKWYRCLIVGLLLCAVAGLSMGAGEAEKASDVLADQAAGDCGRQGHSGFQRRHRSLFASFPPQIRQTAYDAFASNASPPQRSEADFQH